MSKETTTPKAKDETKAKAAKTQEAQRRRLPEPPRTAFNFVAAEIDGRRKKRQSIMIVGSVAVVAFTLTATLGLWAQGGVAAAKKEQAALETKIQEARATVVQAFGAGDFDVPKHTEIRLAQLSATLGSDVDVLPLLELLRKAGVPGVKVSSVAIALESATGGAEAAPAATTTTDPNATTTTTSPPKVTYEYRIRLTANGTGFEDALTYKKSLVNEPLFSNVNVTQSGTPEAGIQISADFIVATKVLTPRFNKIQEELGLATEGTPTTVTGTTDGQ